MNRLEWLEKELAAVQRRNGMNAEQRRHEASLMQERLTQQNAKNEKTDTRIETVEATTNDVVLLMADLIGGE